MAGNNYYNIPPTPDPNPNQTWNPPIPDRHPQFAHNPMPHSRLNMPPSFPHPNLPIQSNGHPQSMIHPRSNLNCPSNFHPDYPTLNPNTYFPPSYPPTNHFPSNHSEPIPYYPPTNYPSSSHLEAGPSDPPQGPPHGFTEHHRIALKRKNRELHMGPSASYSSPVEARNWSCPVGDESQRNVRSRPGYLYTSPLEPNNINNNLARNYAPNNNVAHQPFFPHGNGNVSALRGPERNSFSSYLPPPQARNITDHASYNFDLNHGHDARNNNDLNHGHHARNNMVPTMHSELSYHPQNRNPNVPFSTHHSRVYESASSVPRMDHHVARQSYVGGSMSARWRHVGTDFDASISRQRPLVLSDGGINSARIRNSDSGFRASFHVDRAPNRWLFEQFGGSEGPLMFDSNDLFDQHRDMRMDIDSMSYEELLALGERIGYVNAGLPDERISKCLKEFTYSTCNQTESDEEQPSCVICLESYEEGNEVGRLKCAHDFHTSCIKKWLQMKNACPVCKSAAFEDHSS